MAKRGKVGTAKREIEGKAGDGGAGGGVSEVSST